MIQIVIKSRLCASYCCMSWKYETDYNLCLCANYILGREEGNKGTYKDLFQVHFVAFLSFLDLPGCSPAGVRFKFFHSWNRKLMTSLKNLSG